MNEVAELCINLTVSDNSVPDFLVDGLLVGSSGSRRGYQSLRLWLVLLWRV